MQLLESGGEAFEVAGVGRDDHVDVLGRADMPICLYGDAADDQVVNPVAVERTEDLDGISGRVIRRPIRLGRPMLTPSWAHRSPERAAPAS
jgi:hypothetical protein